MVMLAEVLVLPDASSAPLIYLVQRQNVGLFVGVGNAQSLECCGR